MREERPFGFAGLYENWKAKDGTILQTCTIITTRPNELMIPIHNRMPAIITPDKRKLWLDTEVQDPELLMPLLTPYDSKELDAFEVSKKVNSPTYNEPDCIKPATNEEQQSLGLD
jgi:putative SOS response-associated peptidase YedK